MHNDANAPVLEESAGIDSAGVQHYLQEPARRGLMEADAAGGHHLPIGASTL